MTNKVQEQDSKGGQKKSKLILVMIIVGMLLGVGGVKFLANGNSALASMIFGDNNKVEELQNLPLNEFIVNLSDANYRRYLKVSLVLEFSKNKKLAAEIEANNHIVRDAIIGLLSSKSVTDISSVKGKETLKKELIEEVNKNLSEGKVENLFWTDFVIQ